MPNTTRISARSPSPIMGMSTERPRGRTTTRSRATGTPRRRATTARATERVRRRGSSSQSVPPSPPFTTPTPGKRSSDHHCLTFSWGASHTTIGILRQYLTDDELPQQAAQPTELGQEKQSHRGGSRRQGVAVHVRQVQPGPRGVGVGRRFSGGDLGRDPSGRESEVVFLAALSRQGQGSGGPLLAAAPPAAAAHHHHR